VPPKEATACVNNKKATFKFTRRCQNVHVRLWKLFAEWRDSNLNCSSSLPRQIFIRAATCCERELTQFGWSARRVDMRRSPHFIIRHATLANNTQSGVREIDGSVFHVNRCAKSKCLDTSRTARNVYLSHLKVHTKIPFKTRHL
jgi:hypothetical protein